MLAELLGQHRLARQLFVGEEDAEIGIDLRRARKRLCFAKAACLVVVGLAAVLQREGDIVPAGARQERAIENLRLDVLDAVARIDAQHGCHLFGCRPGVAGLIGPGHEMVAAQARLAHDLLEGDVGGARHRGQQRAAGDGLRIARGLQQHLQIGALHHVGLVAVVHHGESRRHVGLERELLEQAGAQRVDRLYLQPTRRLQRAGEQFSRFAAQLSVRMGDAYVADRCVECGIIQRHPMAKRGEHALGHVGGGGLGEGDAEDLFRRHARQQQADHALHQHMCLARAGIGRHERGRGRVRRAPLSVAHSIRDWA